MSIVISQVAADFLRAAMATDDHNEALRYCKVGTYNGKAYIFATNRFSLHAWPIPISTSPVDEFSLYELKGCELTAAVTMKYPPVQNAINAALGQATETSVVSEEFSVVILGCGAVIDYSRFHDACFERPARIMVTDVWKPVYIEFSNGAFAVIAQNSEPVRTV